VENGLHKQAPPPYSSENTKRLDVEQTKTLLLELDCIKEALL
jgi:hypothetical protein